ncbi:MAG: glycosyltransferase family 2 protein [Chloroflexi bacterium]|nr:glycosyltransferase family 2 protein [Chloroflexota bacterium]
MSGWQLCTPVAFIIFNRPGSTEQVFAEIARAKPPKLLVVADGPRESHPHEAEKCLAARAVIDRVDWDCEVLTNFATSNMGCKNRVASGLDWVFQQVDQAIILEDDCLPHPTFFRFCAELLEKYHDDERIMMVAGSNLRPGQERAEYSYHFSRYSQIWGWATWRRSWQNYDVDMKLWPVIRDEHWLEDILEDRRAAQKWSKPLQTFYDGHAETWDTQWMFACWIQSGLTVIPRVNLVSNIGFGPDAVHTKDPTSRHANLPTEAMSFPLRHPPFIVRDIKVDRLTEENLFDPKPTTILKRAIAKMGRLARYHLHQNLW